MDANDLASYIEDNGINSEMVFLAEETPTVEAAASAVGVRQDQIGKSLLFLADGEPILIIANGTTRISYKRLAKYLGITRKKLKLANPGQVEGVTGYVVGSVPPFGHRQPIETLIEKRVLREREIYAGGGATNVLIRISTIELLQVTSASIVELNG